MTNLRADESSETIAFGVKKDNDIYYVVNYLFLPEILTLKIPVVQRVLVGLNIHLKLAPFSGSANQNVRNKTNLIIINPSDTNRNTRVKMSVISKF